MKQTVSYDRYHRQLILKDFGVAGQQKLQQAKVLVAGAGGLGCPALLYLAAAGVGAIGIVDDDKVALSNLHRQVLYTVDDIGQLKARKAAEKLSRLNPEIEITDFCERLTTQNALSLIESFDIIIDGSDNFATRYLINDAAVLLNKPVVYGAVSQFEGQVAIFNCNQNGFKEGVNYRDLFPIPPKEDEVPNCAEAGVLGVLPGIIGTMQANETIKLVAGIGQPLINRMITFNALNNQWYELELSPGPGTRSLIPANEEAFRQTDYEWLCGSEGLNFEIDQAIFDKLFTASAIDVVDVRELDEIPEIEEFTTLKIPMKELSGNAYLIKSDTVVTICQTGKRSLEAAKQLAKIFGTSKKIFSLKGGIISWKEQHSNQML